jgi:hypothetical protein
LKPLVSASHKEKVYYGHIAKEHSKNDIKEIKEKRKLASIDNITSFVFSRPSLINLLSHVGFSSVYECFNPPHLNFGMPGLEHVDRCTILAIKGQRCRLHTSPLANSLQEDWPEGSLSYASETNEGTHQTGRRRLKRALSYGRSFLEKIIPNRVR